MPFPLLGLLGAAERILDKVIPDPTAKAQALAKLKELEQNGDLAVISGQIEVAKIEAANPKLFVSGARPFVLWVCASALAVQLVLGPLVVWVTTLAGRAIALPVMQTELLTTLLVGLLGLGGLRTVEKLQGVASK